MARWIDDTLALESVTPDGTEVLRIIKGGASKRVTLAGMSAVFSSSVSAAASAALSATTSAANASISASVAAAAVNASGNVVIYDTYAAASAALSGLAANQIVEVIADETRGGLRTRYRKESSALVYKMIVTPLSLDIGSQSFVNVAKDKATAVPIWPWLPDPAYAADGQQGIVIRRNAAPMRVTASSSKWYKDSDESEVTPWWVPTGATFVLEVANNRGYWASATKTLADLTSVTVGGKSRYKLNSQNLGIDASQEYTVLVEFTASATGTYASASECLFSFTQVAGNGGRNELSFTQDHGDANLFHARQGGSSANYSFPIGFSTPAAAHCQARGRRRLIWTSPTTGGTPIRNADGYPSATTGTATSGTIAVDRIGIGYRVLNGLEDSAWTDDTAFGTLRVVVWPYAMTAAEVKAASQHSERGLRHIYILGDSYLSTQYYNTSGKMVVDGVRHALGSAGYRSIVMDSKGSTSWYADATGTDTFVNRLASRTDDYKKYCLAVVDGVWEHGQNGQPELEKQGILYGLEWLGNSRFLVTDSQLAAGYTPTTIEAINSRGAMAYISPWLGAAYAPMYSALAAVNDGSPTDLAAVANGCIPPSITSDGLHPNATVGAPAYSAALVTKMTALGWLATGQW